MWYFIDFKIREGHVEVVEGRGSLCAETSCYDDINVRLSCRVSLCSVGIGSILCIARIIE